MLLQLVMKRAEAFAPAADGDAALLHRFAETGDEAAFAELLQRHGPMVWSVCRNLLADDADADDSFQAVFLALVRSAKTVRNAEAVGAWLHGVAVRIAVRAKRTAVRQRQREERAAEPEADRPVPEAAWNELLAAVHEEVQRLPDSLRTAFVMCELEGVRQPDAAIRLGWKPGTLTGRLTRARQLIVERLANRGLAPALAGGGLALGQATACAAVPGPLMEGALNLIRAGGNVPAAVLNLAKGASPMVAMRSKLLAFSVLFAGGLGAVLFPMATAQPPGQGASGGGAPPPMTGSFPKPGVAPPAMTAGGPGGAPGFGGGMTKSQWEYKFVTPAKDHVKQFAGLGDDGWEYCGPIPGENVAFAGATMVFKRAKAPASIGGTFGGPGTGPGGSGAGGGAGFGFPPPMAGASGGGSSFGPPMGGGGSASSGGSAPQPPEQKLVVIAVRNSVAAELSTVLERVFKNGATITADPRTNSLIIRANEATMEEVKALVEKLDKLTPTPAVKP